MPGPSSDIMLLNTRKLRKKLRQIENLEQLERQLTPEEKLKISKKFGIREELQGLLCKLPCGPEDPPRTSTSLEDKSPDVGGIYWSSSSSTKAAASIGAVADRRRMDDDDGQTNEEDQQDEDYEWSSSISSEGASIKSNTVPHSVLTSTPRLAGEQSVHHLEQTKETGQDKYPLKKPKKEKVESDSTLDEEYIWGDSAFQVQVLDGHNDLVCSVDSDSKYLVSAGRDTMVKVWDLKSGLEQRSFGGHTQTVTSVLIAPTEFCRNIGITNESGDVSSLVISASLDCSICLWSVNTGQMVKSIYTYNPITCLGYLGGSTVPQPQLIISGSGGGKLDTWDMLSGENVQTLQAHGEAVTAIEVAQEMVYSSSKEGLIKAYRLQGQILHLIFVSENIKCSTGATLVCQHIRAMVADNHNIYYGDDGINLKVLNWRQGLVHKLSNHNNEFGSTDALFANGKLLLSSGYDLDNGLGYVNVRSLPNEKYLCTLCDDDTSRIFCLTCSQYEDDTAVIITGGLELKIWRKLTPSKIQEEDDFICADYDQRFDWQTRNTDVESDMEVSETDQDSDEGMYHNLRRKTSDSDQSEKGWLSWCAVL